MIKPTDLCTGCFSCYQSCPVNAISIWTSGEGFAYPKISSNKCVGCGKCDNACSLGKENHKSKTSSAFAAFSNDKEIRKVSSSGGIFSLIAENVITNGGYVFGAAFNNDFTVSHIAVSNITEIARLRESKYLQSDTSNAFTEVKKHLDSGKVVLFSGTPCQIAGLHSFLGKEYDNLICQDIICHSVPSPEVWKHYLCALTKEEVPIEVHFRDKTDGWENYALTVLTESGSIIRSHGKNDPYIRAFISGLESRKSCASCQFKCAKSGSDITLADCWGIKQFAPDFYDQNGVSLVLINTAKGKKIFDSVSNKCRFTQVDYDLATSANPHALYPSAPHKRRNRFLKLYKGTTTVDDFAQLYADCVKPKASDKVFNLISRIKQKIKRTLSLNKDKHR